MISRLVLATHNKGKVSEFQALLDGLVGDIKSVGEWSAIEPAETGTTFVENATIKAMAAITPAPMPPRERVRYRPRSMVGSRPAAVHRRAARQPLRLIHRARTEPRARIAPVALK